jgi:hypothetical protein
VLLCACRTHPCGDEEGTAPAELAKLPLVQDGGKICFASSNAADKSEEATLMYWGDEIGSVTAAYVTALDGAGWKSFECAVASKDRLCFASGERKLFLTTTQSETPRLGSKLMAPSITVKARLEQP